jgi:diketogulonate reductase-like aldo/keto reductase
MAASINPTAPGALSCYNCAMIQPTRAGKPIFPLGIGTWNISSEYYPDPAAKYKARAVHGNEEAEIEALRYSLGKGQNHIHCAELYGGFYTDEVIGRALAGQIREDLSIADTLWKSSVGPGLVRPTVEQMLKKLGTDYLDLLYIHSPWPDAAWRAAIPQIDELIDEGIVRQLGVSNFTIDDMQEVIHLAKHPIAANQMEYNVLYKDEVTEVFRTFCQQHDITIVAYQPIKRGEVLHHETVQRIAAAHQATPAQVALAWLVVRGALPIPKAVTKAHIDENLGALELKLSAAELAELDLL